MRSNVLIPVYLTHALLHQLQILAQILPVGFLFHQNLFCGRNTHGSHEVDTLRCSTKGGLAIIVHHLLQHFCIGLITLWHHTYLIVTGLLELRADTCLYVANLLEITLQLVHGLLVLDEFLHGHTGLFHFADNLLDA